MAGMYVAVEGETALTTEQEMRMTCLDMACLSVSGTDYQIGSKIIIVMAEEFLKYIMDGPVNLEKS